MVKWQSGVNGLPPVVRLPPQAGISICRAPVSFMLVIQDIMDLWEQNTFCKESGVTSLMLFNSESFPHIPSLKKGLVLELMKIKKSNGKSWPIYKDWIEKIIHNSISLNALRRSVLALESQREKIAKNVHRVGSSTLDKFLNEEYKLPQSGRLCSSSAAKLPDPVHDFQHQITTAVNKSLAAEIAELKARMAVNEEQRILKDKKIEKIITNSRNNYKEKKEKKRRKNF